ncbi:hypothetical protein CHLRE_01g021650v5 [Chlamydomonas reinhardtii]|uniref:Uncharacterized protein n=1 Tax=Chlamydomonas reinhardtii TaxID=3055 RepID=A0A2K3E633_CHLRE|nr:uncharacterized protein CHLRE_01g021650v5 [Chlamydomonas reinhardtii]PNW88261.1 hypothetical protein CHLRE_01g021650v5 [Chlamydomonas reinhardtii]
MVHVPFFGIDLPEPRLAAVMPDAVYALVQGTHKLGEYAHDLVFPPTPEDLRKLEQQVNATIPREFDRVRQRYAEGKIANDEQLSSELEDASFNWYRRQLRTSVVGATDEELEDVAVRKLRLEPPALQASLQERALAAAVTAAGGVDLAAEVADAAALAALAEQEAETRRLLAARQARLADLRKQLRPAHRQAIGTITNASAGMLVGVLVVKSVLTLVRRLFRKKRPAGAKAPAGAAARRQGSVQSSAAQLQSLAAPAARQQQQSAAAALASAQQAAMRPQAGASASAAAAASGKAAASKEQPKAGAAAAAADAGAKKTRIVKKR